MDMIILTLVIIALVILTITFIISILLGPIGGLFGQKSGLSMEDTIRAMKDNRRQQLSVLQKNRNELIK